MNNNIKKNLLLKEPEIYMMQQEQQLSTKKTNSLQKKVNAIVGRAMALSLY